MARAAGDLTVAEPVQGVPDLADWGAEVWVGGVNPWDCDRMGHLNTRFYVAHMRAGLAVLSALLGLGGSFAPDASSILRIDGQQIRFLKEARVGAALSIRAGVVRLGESDGQIALLMLHDGGEIAASTLLDVTQLSRPGDAPLPWGAAVRDAAASLTVTLPAAAAPRGVAPFRPETGVSLGTARDLGMMRIGVGVFDPADCDLFGRMRLEQLIARVSDGISRVADPLQKTVAARAAEPVPHAGGAVLEYHAAHHAWPGIGDRWELRSGLVGVQGKVLRFAHWMLDPGSDRVWATLDGVAVILDLDRRRAVEITAEAREALAVHLLKTNTTDAAHSEPAGNGRPGSRTMTEQGGVE